MITVEEELVADAPAVSLWRSVRYWAAALALGVMFLAVTKGPVFWIRLEIDRTVARRGLIEDGWVQVTFLTSAALVLALAFPAVRVLWADRPVTVAFGVFLLTVLASSLWSINPSQTAEQSAMFLVGSVAALAGGAYLRRFDALLMLWIAMQAGIAASIWAWSREWPRLYNFDGDFAGIFFNKNSLGPVAMIGAASSLALGVEAWRRGAWWVAPFTFATMAVNGFVYWQSGSFTSAFAAAVAFGAVALFSLLVPGRFERGRRRLGVVAAAAVVVIMAVVIASRAQINTALDRPNTLSGRPIIWEVVLDYAAERPIGGWGFVAVWTKPDIIESLGLAGHGPVFEAHSGYLEVLLGVGVIGLAMLLVVVAVSVIRVGQAMWRAPSVMAAWSVGVLAFALASNLTETFVGANLLVWVLLCVVAGSAVVVTQQTTPAGAEGEGGGERDDDDGVDPGPPDDTPPLGVMALDLEPDEAFDFSFDESSGYPLGDPLLVRDEWGSATSFGDTDDELDVRR